MFKDEEEFEGSPALARGTDPQTSHEAAAGVNTTAQELKVLKALYVKDLQTMEEVTFWLAERGLCNREVGIDSITPRFAPLQRKGLIEDTGKKRLGRSNRKRIVWGITTLGIKIFERSLKEARELGGGVMGNTKDLAHRMEREIEEIHKRKAGAFDKLERVLKRPYVDAFEGEMELHWNDDLERFEFGWALTTGKTLLEAIEALEEE